MLKSGKCQFLRPGSASGFVMAFYHQNASARAGQHDRRGQTVRAGSDDCRVVAFVSHGCLVIRVQFSVSAFKKQDRMTELNTETGKLNTFF